MNKRLVKDNANNFESSMIVNINDVKDILATSSGVHSAPRPSLAATFTHLYQRIRAARINSIIYTSAFTPLHSSRLLHAVIMQLHSRHTYAAYAAAPTQHLLCHTHATAFFRRSHAAAFVLCSHGIFYSSIHATACTEQHLCLRSHAPGFMRIMQLHLCCSIHAAAFFCRSHAAALMPSHLCCFIYAAAFAPPHARCHICTAAFTPLSLRSIDAVALTPQQWCCRSDAAAFMQHLACHSLLGAKPHAAAFTPLHLRCRLRTAAFTLQLSRVEADHLERNFQRRALRLLAGADASSRPGRGAGRGRAGGRAAFKKGCFGVGWGGILCTYISPKGVCDG